MTVLLVLSCVVLFTAPVLTLPPTEPPLIEGHPFIPIWNIPTEKCKQFQIHLDTSAFQVVTTPKLVRGQFLTIFYEDRLGLYPKVDTTTHETINGGIPQRGNLKTHLAIAKSQMEEYISKDSPPGLAVIDWEAWRPLWDRNWGSKRVYQKLSIAHALQKDPYSSMSKISAEAKCQFQEAGRHFMEETLALGVRERLSRRWGFYLFPDCYNYNWNHTGYTGKCPADAQKQNNQLLWLWEQSTALFPSIYIHLHLKNSPKTTLFARNRVQEAVRVSKLPKRPHTVPIYIYLRPLYRDQNLEFLSEMDLVSTIGESAALGASGIIKWGGTKDYHNKGSCRALSEYLLSTLNPYVANVTAAATLCSEVLCQGEGRCVRRDHDSDHYLHLNPADFSIKRTDGKYVAAGLPSAADLRTWAQRFTCQCYQGSSCSPKLVHPKTSKHICVQTLY